MKDHISKANDYPPRQQGCLQTPVSYKIGVGGHNNKRGYKGTEADKEALFEFLPHHGGVYLGSGKEREGNAAEASQVSHPVLHMQAKGAAEGTKQYLDDGDRYS